MKIKRIEHVAVVVDRLDPGMRMLQDIFGLQLAHAEETPIAKLAMFPVGESSVELVQPRSPDSRGGRWLARHGQSLYHLCFEVEDIAAALDELRAKGVRLQDQVPRRGHGGSQVAFIDPESTGGLLIELVQLPPGGH